LVQQVERPQVGRPLDLRRVLVEVVLVLDLEEDDAAVAGWPTRDLLGRDDRADGLQPVLGPGEEDRIIRPQPGQAAGRYGLGRRRRNRIGSRRRLKIQHTAGRALGVCRHLGQEPAGKAAPIPLGADVGAGPDDRVEAELVLRHPDPGLQVGQVDLGEILQGGRHPALVPVPGDIGLDRVAARLLDLAEAVAPERRGAAEVLE
jgi:hypothetical protein